MEPVKTEESSGIALPAKPVPKPVPPPEEREFLVVGKVAPLSVENPGVLARKIPIALSCAQCAAKMQRDPTTVPFRDGPFKGGFLCKDCWTLYWDDHPEILANAESRQWVARQARAIRLKRAGAGSELIFEEDGNRIYLTGRGTVIVDLRQLPFGSPDEYDGSRYRTLMKLFEAARVKGVPGYELEPPKE